MFSAPKRPPKPQIDSIGAILVNNLNFLGDGKPSPNKKIGFKAKSLKLALQSIFKIFKPIKFLPTVFEPFKFEPNGFEPARFKYGKYLAPASAISAIFDPIKFENCHIWTLQVYTRQVGTLQGHTF